MDYWEYVLLAGLELFGALVGAFSGVYFGTKRALKLERTIRQDAENEEKEDVVKSLYTELMLNKNYLDKGLETRRVTRDRANKFERGFWWKLSDASFNSLIYSGNLHLFIPETQMNLIIHYSGIKRMNELTSNFEMELQIDKDTYYTITSIETVYSGLIGSIPDIIALLQKEISIPLVEIPTVNQESS